MPSPRGYFGGVGGGDSFPDPFVDVATLAMPQNMRTALQMAEYIFLSHGTYRMAVERIISYFLTDIEFGDEDVPDDEKDKWEEFLRETLNVLTNLQAAWRNRWCYGISFTSLLVPFKRFLVCPKCALQHPLKVVYNNGIFRFEWSGMQFIASCPACHFRGAWKVDDKPEDSERKLKIKHWNPHEIEILQDYYGEDAAYLWRIPEDYKQQIRKGTLFHLERCAMPVLKAIEKNQMFRFNPDVIFRMREPVPAGIRDRGWGIPRALTNFRQIYYVQVLRRYNEAIALDYVIPFRLITPAPRPGAGGGGSGAAQMSDPMLSFNLGDFRSQVTSMLRRRRRDPASFNMLPFPVQYQQLGGDASKLAPVDLIANGMEQLLNDIGTPVDFYKGTLQMQTSGPALRLFEATHAPMVHEGNSWLKWLSRQVSQVMSWNDVSPGLKRVTIADDIQKQMMIAQLFAGQQMSGTTAFKAINQDWKAEQRRMGEEAMFQAEQQSRIQDEMSQTGFAQQMAKGNVVPGQGGAPGQPGAPGAGPAGGGSGGAGNGPGGQPGAPQGGAALGPVDNYVSQMSANTPIDPEQMMQTAQNIAQELLGLPESVKNQQLRTLKAKDNVMHSIVRACIDKIRQGARTTGGNQLIQQQYGQNGGGGQGQ